MAFSLVCKKKEVLDLHRERDLLDEVFSGIRHMKGLPGLIFITDIKHEHIAVAEARRLKIPVVAICDTNVDPDQIQYAIPGNDDAVKSVQLIANYLASQLVNTDKIKSGLEAKKPKTTGA